MNRVRRRTVLQLGGCALVPLFVGCTESDDEDGGNTTTARSKTATRSTEGTPTQTHSATPTLAVDPDDLPGYVRPINEPERVPESLTCTEEEFTRLYARFNEDNLAWGQLQHEGGGPAFVLRVNKLEFERGDEVRLTLTNVRNATLETGYEKAFHLQLYTEEGWVDVRGWTGERGPAYTQEAVLQKPGSGFEWNLPLTEEGLHVNTPELDMLIVCPGLLAGRYRFVFWALDDDSMAVPDAALAVAFDVVE